MERPTLIAALALALAASATPALALDNNQTTADRCHCMCVTPNFEDFNFYQANGLSCSLFEGRTCNVRNPGTQLIETGRTFGCIEESLLGTRLNGTFTIPGDPQVPQLQVAPQGTFSQ
jgi:hypothetical protein